MISVIDHNDDRPAKHNDDKDEQVIDKIHFVTPKRAREYKSDNHSCN